MSTPILIICPQRHGSTFIQNAVSSGGECETLGEVAPLVIGSWLGATFSNSRNFSLSPTFLDPVQRESNIADFTRAAIESQRDKDLPFYSLKYGVPSNFFNLMEGMAKPANAKVDWSAWTIASKSFPDALNLCLLREPLDAARSWYRMFHKNTPEDRIPWAGYWNVFSMTYGLMERAISAGGVPLFFADFTKSLESVSDSLAAVGRPTPKVAFDKASKWWAAPAGDRSLDEAREQGFARTDELPESATSSISDEARLRIEAAWAAAGRTPTWA